MFAVVLSIHILICIFLVFFVLLQKSEGGGLGIGQSNSGGLGDFLSTRSTSNILTKTTSILAVCFFLTSISLVESGRLMKDGSTVAWPWSLNHAGRSVFFDSREQALKYLKKNVK